MVGSAYEGISARKCQSIGQSVTSGDALDEDHQKALTFASACILAKSPMNREQGPRVREGERGALRVATCCSAGVPAHRRGRPRIDLRSDARATVGSRHGPVV